MSVASLIASPGKVPRGCMPWSLVQMKAKKRNWSWPLMTSLGPLSNPTTTPTGDLGLLRALDIGSARELEERTRGWRPWRAYAAMYLWSVGGPEGRRAKDAHARKTGKAPGRKAVAPREMAVAV